MFVLGKPLRCSLMFAGKARSLPVWIQILDLAEIVAEENTGLNAFFINDKYCVEGTEMRQLGFKVRRLLFLNRY